MSTDDKRIREFAYQIWESEGKPAGQENRHWEMARKLAEAEALAPSKPPKAASKSAASKTDGAKPAAAKSTTAKTAAKTTTPKAKPAAKAAATTADKKPRATRKPPAV
ncbi:MULTISPECIES: DUF2934 domain-containing protein [Pseudomonas]|uniref:DUF2934 domain-containing protein n=1 Tax=Pseudomonas brassicacearum (strain NFM421) TaxID=994484 RepID=F2KHM7_PSEBN|nr:MULTISPECIES: DUF2934 domain-containing protein [Pseudomonas]KIR14099.1 hypothetical protein PFLU4_48350 [Pseudomonas fluorescens]AEA69313.1 Conserved hypothetical protein [Pseudomonas brassicacearum subsp. brassicacearum NFM421]ALQ03867.1 hypothetical protein AK973_3418 [Pseudomonas brassicacearum]AOS37402.1 hypothetical protein A0U95_01115 [Pseudomonas brassicacearum]PJH89545.1 DUF2934 domain-containing protein [Pseudomonas sp. WCS365]